eukprot:2745180-Pyramimonas_sp.AAC.1
MLQLTSAPPIAPPAAMPHLYLLPHPLADLSLGALAQSEPPPDEDYASIDHEAVPNPSALDLELMAAGGGDGDGPSGHDSDIAMQADEHAPHPGPHLSDAEFELQLERVLRRSRGDSDDDMARGPTASSSGGAPRPA